ncbi:MAG TPA: biotin/lipoate A/B protein ligase family protein [Gemmata sp.]|nr:biotin/lipoate A/B protein ligase family protein [Gemmata sp.]
MTPRIRLLPLAAADGPTNMAADEAMLESASESDVASLRFYTWDCPTLTLGYFQESASRESPRFAGLPWVRRSTGGAAILHHRELTYSFALPARSEWKSDDPWICRVHRLLREVLLDRGVEARVVACGEEVKRGAVLCFLHHTAGDLAIGESKVAGSAQRKMRGSLLQHGSLLLRRSKFAEELPGMCDLAGRELFTPEELAEMLTAKFAACTGVTIEPGDWTAAERDRTAAIRAAKYANAEWNGRR